MGILKKLVISPSDFSTYTKEIGAKSINLKKLQEAGFRVPEFVVIPAEVCWELYTGKILNLELAKELLEELVKVLPVESYAVRSSALVEDRAETSLAGQFQTELKVTRENFLVALEKVLKQAEEYLKGDLRKFSVIIQRYLEPDFAGVLFTRNPLGSREMILEYAEGNGEKVVGGLVMPEQVELLPDDLDFFQTIPGLNIEKDRILSLEKIFGFPQDMEWCVKDKVFYFLQTRPITTISVEQYEQWKYLDTITPTGKNYFWEKNEIAEIAPRPSEFTWSLLKKIYAEGGPVDLVYKKYGVKFRSSDFLVKVGNELFVDKEKELKQLLPSYSYFGGIGLKPHRAEWKGFVRTLNNIFALGKIKVQEKELWQELKEKLERPMDLKSDLSELLEKFLMDYQLIFEINLLADKALKNLVNFLKNEGIQVAELLSAKLNFLTEESIEIAYQNQLCGNALEINNEDKFVGQLSGKKENPDVEKWLKAFPSWKKPYLEKVLFEADYFLKLREYGRWLTVKHISEMRECLFKIAKRNNFDEVRNIYFAGVNECLSGKILEHQCQGNRAEYKKFENWNFPNRITNRQIKNELCISGVAAGVARGKLVVATEDNLTGGILFTKVLQPDLTKYFNQIVGIVSEEGGLLSHLAIMARENHIPVIVGFNLEKSGIKIGDMVEMDGSQGIVKRLEIL